MHSHEHSRALISSRKSIKTSGPLCRPGRCKEVSDVAETLALPACQVRVERWAMGRELGYAETLDRGAVSRVLSSSPPRRSLIRSPLAQAMY